MSCIIILWQFRSTKWTTLCTDRLVSSLLLFKLLLFILDFLYKIQLCTRLFDAHTHRVHRSTHRKCSSQHHPLTPSYYVLVQTERGEGLDDGGGQESGDGREKELCAFRILSVKHIKLQFMPCHNNIFIHFISFHSIIIIILKYLWTFAICMCERDGT